MPIIVAMAARALIQAAISLGILTLIENYALPLINKAIQEVMEFFGVSEEDAQDIMANEVLAYAESIGILAVTLRTKIPTKIAERLGFTTKGWVKRPLSTKAGNAKAGVSPGGIILDAKAPATVAKIAETVAKTKGVSFDTASKVANVIVATLGVPIGIGLLITNTIDFGAWSSSAYQGTFQKLLALVGLEPDAQYNKSRVMSDDMSKKIVAVYELEGVKQIHNPFTGETVPFNKDNLIAVADKIAAAIIAEKGQVTTKEMIGSLTALMIYGEKPAPKQTITATVAAATLPPLEPIKVYTGIVSKGTLGDQTPFIAREDDLIDSMVELQGAAQNNLASFLQGLPGRLTYELKIASSVVDKDGSRRLPSTQRIIASYKKDGTPNYKTITNKFAVLDVFIFTSRNVRSKIISIILGPTDAVKLNPSQVVLQAISANVTQVIHTTDINQVQNIITNTPVSVTPQQQAAPVLLPVADPTPMVAGARQSWNLSAWSSTSDGKWNIQPTLTIDGQTFRFNSPDAYIGVLQQIKAMGATGPVDQFIQQLQNVVPAFRNTTRPQGSTQPQGSTAQQIQTSTINQAAAAVATVSTDPARARKLAATTLYEYYAADGRALPSISERSQLYQNLTGSPASWYTGTAEQNTKLLAALKQRL